MVKDTAKKSATSELSVLDVTRRIRSRELAPGTLSVEVRRMCVLHFGAEGLSVPEMAQILQCSDRTITRDRRALQEEGALYHDPELAARLAGQLLAEANNARTRIARVARDQLASHAVRIEAERVSMHIMDSTIERLQKLGVLPQAATHIQADLTHSIAETPSYEDLLGDLDQLIALQNEQGVESQELLALRDETTRGQLAARVLLSAPQAPESDSTKEDSSNASS